MTSNNSRSQAIPGTVYHLEGSVRSPHGSC